MDADSKIYIAGHRGMVGSALIRKLKQEGYLNLVTRSRQELDLTRQDQVEEFFRDEQPEYVFLAAAKVGGILANSTYPAEFIYENIVIQTNVIHQSYLHGVNKFLFLGSSCIYPKHASQPLKEEHLLTGPLEPTNEAYAVAKIAGVKMCQAYSRQYGTNYISVMPANLYGPGDNCDLETSHVLAALLRKFTEAKEQSKPHVEVWGSGKPLREFLHVDDLADACLFLMCNYDNSEIINVGSGQELTIAELAELLRRIIGFKGNIIYDSNKPDGTPRKLLDNSKLASLGWQPTYSIEQGVEMAYKAYKKDLPK